MAPQESLLAEFLTLQQERASHYSRLHDSFREMLDSKDETAFLALIPELTQRFAEISKNVIGIEAQLTENDHERECARLIRAVQLGERSKLQATMQIHALRKAYEFKELTWQHALFDDTSTLSPEQITEHGYREQLRQSTAALDAAIAQINESLEEIRYLRLEGV